MKKGSALFLLLQTRQLISRKRVPWYHASLNFILRCVVTPHDSLDKLQDDSGFAGGADPPVCIQRQPHPSELVLLRGTILAESAACPTSFERYYRIFIIRLDCVDSRFSVFKYQLPSWTWEVPVRLDVLFHQNPQPHFFLSSFINEGESPCLEYAHYITNQS